MTAVEPSGVTSFDALAETIERDGLVGMPGAFPRSWGLTLREDFDVLFAEARSREHGTITRGPQRWYFAVHPERLRGFLELVTHPLVAGLSEHMLGPDYEFVETGFDVPLPGAVHQPWHRDFRMPEETRLHRRLSSLAFNVSAADVTPDMGPFEFAPGTQWETGEDFAHEMFPPKSEWPRYEALRQQRRPQLGDMSARTGLAIHRGTPNDSNVARPAMILGVVSPEAPRDDVHELEVSRRWFEALPGELRRRLRCRVVDELQPLVQRHDIEGLMMG